MGMELSKKRKGEKTSTGMTESQLSDFATKKKKKKMDMSEVKVHSDSVDKYNK